MKLFLNLRYYMSSKEMLRNKRRKPLSATYLPDYNPSAGIVVTRWGGLASEETVCRVRASLTLQSWRYRSPNRLSPSIWGTPLLKCLSYGLYPSKKGPCIFWCPKILALTDFKICSAFSPFKNLFDFDCFGNMQNFASFLHSFLFLIVSHRFSSNSWNFENLVEFLIFQFCFSRWMREVSTTRRGARIYVCLMNMAGNTVALRCHHQVNNLTDFYYSWCDACHLQAAIRTIDRTLRFCPSTFIGQLISAFSHNFRFTMSQTR